MSVKGKAIDALNRAAGEIQRLESEVGSEEQIVNRVREYFEVARANVMDLIEPTEDEATQDRYAVAMLKEQLECFNSTLAAVFERGMNVRLAVRSPQQADGVALVELELAGPIVKVIS